ncbi:MAG TPA: hypothetical protein VK184_16095 [Nostocaceae cyanobacterium]|nr:hypothetical protein [Nostocaceae cyanobacterium]
MINTRLLTADVMVWASGYRLYGDRYFIEQKLGEGGFDITYLAKNHKDQHIFINTT